MTKIWAMFGALAIVAMLAMAGVGQGKTMYPREDNDPIDVGDGVSMSLALMDDFALPGAGTVQGSVNVKIDKQVVRSHFKQYKYVFEIDGNSYSTEILKSTSCDLRKTPFPTGSHSLSVKVYGTYDMASQVGGIVGGAVVVLPTLWTFVGTETISYSCTP